ncbi:MAG TPA: hypothetical protein VK864_13380 [Longimicrobiales bacterium]|nr:hypothetical protein [Longimicrobiales bacterium]
MSDLKYIAFLAVLYLLFKFGPTQVINRILMAFLGKSGLEEVGRKALAAQPDRITLQPGPGPAKPEASNAVTALERRGFERAGSYVVREMKGVNVHLLVKPAEGAVAVVYEHVKAGVWADLASRYVDGTSFTITSAPAGNGLDQMPGHVSVAAPRQSPVVLAARLVTERPAGALRQIRAAEFARVFEQAYEESMAWRKGKGVSAAEVKRAGVERVSA